MPTYDTYIAPLPESEQSVVHGAYTYGYDRHIAVRGFQKLINRWAKAFLTLQGTDLSRRNYGTAFPALIGSNVTDRGDIQEIVQSSVDKATQDIQQLSADALETGLEFDSEELLDSAKLDALVFPDATGIAVYVTLQNQKGQRLQVLLAGTPEV